MPTIDIDRRLVIKLSLAGMAMPSVFVSDAAAELAGSESPVVAPAMCAELHIADDFCMSEVTR